MSIIQGKGNALVQMRKLINRPNPTMLGVVVSVDSVTTVIPGTPGTGGTTYVESRYWRIYITANNGDAYTTLKEVQLISPTDTVLTSPSTVTAASSFYDASPAYVADASKLVDGDTANDETSVWATADASAVPSWVAFDLGAAQAVKSVKVMPQTYSLPTRAPKDFQIQTSPDGTTWTTVKTETNMTGWTAEAYNTVTLPTTVTGEYPEYRYWKLDILSNNGSQYTALQEVELIGETDTDVTTPATTVTGSTYYIPMNNLPANVVDNSFIYEGGDGWISDGTLTSEWLIFDLVSPTALKAVKLMAQTWLPEMEARAPNSFNIQGSADGTAWTTVKTVTGATGWAMQEFKTFNLDAIGGGGTPDTTVTTTGAIAGVDIRGTVYTVSTGGFTLAVGDSVQVASGMVQKKLKGTLGVNTSNIITLTGG